MRKKFKPIAYFVLAVLLLIGYYTREGEKGVFDDRNEDVLSVYFIDVGQADATFFAFPSGETLLIDAGNEADGHRVVNFIKDLGFDKINYVVGTHPHEDHIGGMCDVLRSFEIGSFYMPDAINTTRYYEDMVDILLSSDIDFEIAKAGLVIKEGEEKIEFLSPKEDFYSDLNHYSAVTKVTYKDNSFLVMGDAEEVNEMEMMESFDEELKAEVLRIGHHGSSTSSIPEFIKAVDPVLAIISVGENNDYGHPHRETKATLEKFGIRYLRTDEVGSILVESTGEDIDFITEK